MRHRHTDGLYAASLVLVRARFESLAAAIIVDNNLTSWTSLLSISSGFEVTSPSQDASVGVYVCMLVHAHMITFLRRFLL